MINLQNWKIFFNEIFFAYEENCMKNIGIKKNRGKDFRMEI